MRQKSDFNYKLRQSLSCYLEKNYDLLRQREKVYSGTSKLAELSDTLDEARKQMNSTSNKNLKSTLADFIEKTRKEHSEQSNKYKIHEVLNVPIILNYLFKESVLEVIYPIKRSRRGYGKIQETIYDFLLNGTGYLTEEESNCDFEGFKAKRVKIENSGAVTALADKINGAEFNFLRNAKVKPFAVYLNNPLIKEFIEKARNPQKFKERKILGLGDYYTFREALKLLHYDHRGSLFIRERKKETDPGRIELGIDKNNRLVVSKESVDNFIESHGYNLETERWTLRNGKKRIQSHKKINPELREKVYADIAKGEKSGEEIKQEYGLSPKAFGGLVGTYNRYRKNRA